MQTVEWKFPEEWKIRKTNSGEFSCFERVVGTKIYRIFQINDSYAATVKDSNGRSMWEIYQSHNREIFRTVKEVIFAIEGLE